MFLKIKDYIRIFKSALIDIRFKDKALKKSNKRLVSLLHRSGQLHYELEGLLKEFRTEFKVRLILEGQDDNVLNLDSDSRIKMLFNELGMDDSDIIYHKDSSTQFSRYYSWINKNLFKTETINDSENHFNRVYDYLKNPLVYMQNRVVYFDTDLWRPIEEYLPYNEVGLDMDAYTYCPNCHAMVKKENLVSCICGHVFNKELVTILSDSNGVIERKIQYGKDKFRYEIEENGEVYAATPGLIRGGFIKYSVHIGDLAREELAENDFKDDDEDGWSYLVDSNSLDNGLEPTIPEPTIEIIKEGFEGLHYVVYQRVIPYGSTERYEKVIYEDGLGSEIIEVIQGDLNIEPFKVKVNLERSR